MLDYKPFELPVDGLTRIEDITTYGVGVLHRDGWSAVGLATIKTDSEQRIYAVFRKTESEAVAGAVDDAKKAEEATRKEAAEHRKTKELLNEAQARIVELLDTARAAEDGEDSPE